MLLKFLNTQPVHPSPGSRENKTYLISITNRQ